MNKKIKTIKLDESDITLINALLDEIMQGRDHINCFDFLKSSRIFAHELPRYIREKIYEFRLFEDHYLLVIKNNPVDEKRIGPTPEKLPEKHPEMVQREEVLHLLYSSLLGEPFAWSSIQKGYVINEVFPIKENASLNVSSGSNIFLGLHTEDSFDDNFGEYFGLMCLRNPYDVPTWFCGIDDIALDNNTKRVLFDKRFKIASNPAHHIKKTEAKSAILFGDFEQPYLRVNLNKVEEQVRGDQEAKEALYKLEELMLNNCFPLVLEKGDCLYIDNMKVAHGRKPYTPKYDGKDRWMKRVYITESLKKSRKHRKSSLDRVIFPDNVDLESANKSDF